MPIPALYWNSRSALISAAVLICALPLAAGCGSGSNDSSAQTTRNETVTPFIPRDDVRYIDAIVPHHQRAIQMAQMELDKGTRADIKTMAQSMKDAQTQEVALLQSARQALTGDSEVPAPPDDPHMDRDMQAMQSATGAQVDEMFLDDMIPHHAEGISIAHRALPNLQRADVRDNAKSVVRNQAREIGEMEAMRQ